MSETKKLRTVNDALEWAFEYLGIEVLVDDECSCTCGFPCRNIHQDCMLGRKVPCEGEECGLYCYSGPADFCYRTLDEPIAAPVRRRWTTDPPTEPGWYWCHYSSDSCQFIKIPVLVYEGTDFTFEPSLHIQFYDMGKMIWLTLDKFTGERSPKAWLKIDEPKLPDARSTG